MKRILGVRGLIRTYGVLTVEGACAAALQMVMVILDMVVGFMLV